MLELEYPAHLKPLTAAQFLHMMLPELWHLDLLPSLPIHSLTASLSPIFMGCQNLLQAQHPGRTGVEM